MGYESRIYVVSKDLTGVKQEPEGKMWAEKIAVLNMSKCGDFVNVFEKESDCFVFADDGNTSILEDNYGEPLKEATVDEVVTWLERKIESGEGYRRFKVALALLKSFQTIQWGNEELAVLHYGY